MKSQYRRMATLLLAGTLCAALSWLPAGAHAWGGDGHRIVAWIAEAELPAATRDRIHQLLQGDIAYSLAGASLWADFMTQERPETKPWHYVDIPLHETAFSAERDCAGGDCVVARITYFNQILADPLRPREERREALKFLVHFVADLHQPLHCATRDDKGGNLTLVSFYGASMNLHQVWDSGLIARLTDDPRAMAKRLHSTISPYARKKWQSGNPEDWANEAHRVARLVTYGELPTEQRPEIDNNYLDKARPMVERQLQRAGMRLAHLLRTALAGEH